MTREEQFEAFWKSYPRRVGKGAARKAFDKALKLASAETIMAGLRRQASYLESRSMEFRPHPTTWLNQERWEDEPQPITTNTGRRTIADAARDFNARFGDFDASFGLPSIGHH